MDVKELILEKIEKQGEVRTSEITDITGFSRAYVVRFFQELREKGLITLIGKANKARYIPAKREIINKEKARVKKVFRILKNDGLNEDEVLTQIMKNTGIFRKLNNNVSDILEYAFTEMLNNAIDHSSSDEIEVRMEKKLENIWFEVRDTGVGIFNNIMQKKHLNDEREAIQELLKGKLTTAPDFHSGEGIFFTSHAADMLTIESFGKKLIFDNFVEDIFIKNAHTEKKGTRVTFSIGKDADKNLNEIFRRYTDESFNFSKTEVEIKLYKEKTNFVSRSQARRLLTGLEKFENIILDFKDIDTVGQGFADEIFHIWKKKHPQKNIITRNACDNVEFMIDRARKNKQPD